MYTYIGLAPDLHLIAIGVVVWVVAISIAFGVYLPFIPSEGKLLRGFAPSRARTKTPAYEPKSVWTVEDIDPAAVTVDGANLEAPVGAKPVTLELHISELAASDPLAQPAPPARERPEVFSVLIVDDNAVNRRVMELILDSMGAAHASVENGREAVEAMEACAYDAVLMDLQMPVMDGFEATRRIRALEAACHARPSRIIVVSANCADEDIAGSRQAGADSHLAKPISAAAVIRELQACAAVDRMAA